LINTKHLQNLTNSILISYHHHLKMPNNVQHGLFNNKQSSVPCRTARWRINSLVLVHLLARGIWTFISRAAIDVTSFLKVFHTSKLWHQNIGVKWVGGCLLQISHCQRYHNAEKMWYINYFQWRMSLLFTH